MNKRKTRLGLVLATVAFASLAFSQPARAADYTGDCANIPDHVTGDAVVSDSACVIDTGATLIVDGTLTINAVSVDVKSEIQAVSKVTIRTTTGELKLRRKASSQFSDILLQAPQNRIETKVLEAGNSVQVDAGLNGAEGSIRDIVIDGRIVVNKHQPFPSPDIHANVLLRASGPISTKTIRTDGALGATNIKSGGIQIEAYRTIALAEGAGEFVIGGPGVNGVDGELITRSSVGGGTNSVTTIGGVNIVNGNRFSQGSIRLVNVSAIKINATQSRSGFLELNAQAGKIFLPEGRLDSDSAPGQRAGIVLLLAKTLDVQPGTIISASQAQDDPGSSHQVVIAAETVKFRGGEAGGLKVLADGHGVPGYFGLVQLVPYGYLTPVNTTDQHNNVNQMFWTYTVNTPELAKDGPLTLDGTEGNAPLLLRADGNTAAVNVSGYPLTFKGGDVTIRSRGQTLHRINVGFFANPNGGRPGLEVLNTGNWVLDAKAETPPTPGSAAGGIIQLFTDQVSLQAPNIKILADGPDSGNGDGGTVNIKSSRLFLSSTSKASVSADGAGNGTGNAIVGDPLISTSAKAISIDAGAVFPLILGRGEGEFALSARSGKTGGNAGTVFVKSSGTAYFSGENAVVAFARGSDGDGGEFYLQGEFVFFNPGPDSSHLKAFDLDGKGGGNGGKFTANYSGFNFDVLKTISVRQSNASTTASMNGFIKLNGRKCQLHQVRNPWPSGYWNCINPESPDLPSDEIVFDTAKRNVFDGPRADLSQNNAAIFVFPIYQDIAAFFNLRSDGNDLATGGATFKGIDSDPQLTLYVTVTKQYIADNQVVTLTDKQLRETTAHELGHALDIMSTVTSGARDSANSVYTNFVNWDFANLDFTNLGVDELSSTPRDPCIGINAPFAGVKDATGQFVCVNGALRDPSLVGRRNSYIALTLEPYILDIRSVDSGTYSELYAQAIAYRSVVFNQQTNNSLLTVTFGLFKNNQFACTQGVASVKLSQPSVFPAYCSTSLPAWYVLELP